MARLTLKNEGFPYKNIYSGRQKVGRVFKHQVTGKYHGIIQPHEEIADTENQAFHLVAIKSFGYKSPQEYAQAMANQRARNRADRARVNEAARRYLSAQTMDERWAALDMIFKL